MLYSIGGLGFQGTKEMNFSLLNFRLFFVLVIFSINIMCVSAFAMVDESSPSGMSGTIHVEGEPVGMTITMDGTPRGVVPSSGVLEITPVSEGEHTVGASMEGYQRKDMQITVLDGQITNIRIDLFLQKTGVLDVQSNPTNVQVYLDDNYKGITPVTLQTIPTGDHKILLRLTGYQDWTSHVIITPNDTQIVSGTLNRVSSNLSSPQSEPVPTQSGVFPGLVIFGLLIVVLVTRPKK